MKTIVIFTIATLLSIYAGIESGYFHSHTPPLPFVISGLLLITGILLIIIRKILFENKIIFRIHLILISINLLIVLYCLSPLFI